mgnify:CR=1 FL=1|jgi:addiction module HigA family antidote
MTTFDSATASPGEVIQFYMIEGLNMGVPELARALNVPPNRLYQIIQNKRDISVDTAIRLGVFMGMDPCFWLDIQSRYQVRMMNDEYSAIKNDVIPYQAKPGINQT